MLWLGVWIHSYMDMRRRFECSKKLHLSSKMAVGDSYLGAMISVALGIRLGLQYQAWCSSSLVDLKTNQTSDCQTDMWVGGVYCLFVYNMESKTGNIRNQEGIQGSYTQWIAGFRWLEMESGVMGEGVLAREERGKSIQKKLELGTSNTKVDWWKLQESYYFIFTQNYKLYAITKKCICMHTHIYLYI